MRFNEKAKSMQHHIFYMSSEGTNRRFVCPEIEVAKYSPDKAGKNIYNKYIHRLDVFGLLEEKK
jgi:hypothetical protein